MVALERVEGRDDGATEIGDATKDSQEANDEMMEAAPFSDNRRDGRATGETEVPRSDMG